MKIKKITLAWLAAVVCLASTARAWDPIGHMIVCQTAYDNLTPAAKAKVDASVAAFNAKNKTNYTFVTAGCWMDDVRPTHKEYSPWHYIELPYTPEGTPLPDPSAINALWGFQLCTDILTGKKTYVGVDKDQALVMLSHLVGDIHQPLHTVSRPGDAGGNKVDVPNIKDAKVEVFPNWKNLHYFWDGSYRRTVKDGNVVEIYPEPAYPVENPWNGHKKAEAIIREQSSALQKGYLADKYPATGTPEAWILESHRTGYDEAYQKLPGGEASDPVTLDAVYVDNARVISEQKLIQAGKRLATLLNDIYR